MKAIGSIRAGAVLAGTSLVSAALHAFPIAPPGTEGLSVIVNGTSPVVATYQGNSAAYSDDLYLELDAAGNPGLDGNQADDLFIFNNHGNAVGDTVSLGSFVAGEELIFRLHVNNTGDDFYSGTHPNPDGKLHARVQDNWMPGETLVSFEDLFGTPEGANGYNDLSFSFSNTSAAPTPGSVVPEPSTYAAAIAVLGLVGASHRRWRRA